MRFGTLARHLERWHVEWNIGTLLARWHIYGPFARKHGTFPRLWLIGMQARWQVNHAGTQVRWQVDQVGMQAHMARDLANSC